MPALYTVQTRTDPGCVREINEDAVSTVLEHRASLNIDDDLLQKRGHLFALADGMGGHAAGEIASQLAIRTLFETYYDREQKEESLQTLLRKAIARANEAVCAEAENHPEHAGLGTTLVAAVLHDHRLLIANVGDSRAYLFHRNQLQQITRDHSWVAEQVAAEVLTPEEAARHPYRNVITRSLGPDRNPEPELFQETVHAGDRLLLCSDGLSNVVSHEEIARLLSAYAPDEAADRLMELARERGAPDNVSLALVEFSMEMAQQKRKRGLLLLVTALALLLLALLVREFIATMPARPSPTAAAPSPTTAGAMLTPVVPAAAAIEPPVADPLRVAVIYQETTASPTPVLPTREDYVYFIQGPVAVAEESSNGLRLVLPQKSRGNEAFRYVMLLREGWTAEGRRPQKGDVVVALAQPVDETDLSGDIALDPLMLLAAADPQTAWPALWVKEGDSTAWRTEQTFWLYSVYGPAGGEGLGLSTPPGLSGLPIALRASIFVDANQPPNAAIRPESAIYQWDATENAYLQPN